MKTGTVREHVKYWRVEELNNLELMRATYTDQGFSRHAHETFAIGVVETGLGAFDQRGMRQVAPAWSVFVINPGDVHTGGGFDQSTCTYRVLYPEAEFVRRIASEATGRQQALPLFACPIIHDARLAHLVYRLHRVMEDDSPRLERESLLQFTLGQLAIGYAGAGATIKPGNQEPRAVGLVRDYLEAHFNENVSLADLSSLTGMSGFRLTHVFSAEVGLPPHAFLIQIRVNRAKAMLLRGLPIVEAALEVGFTHQSHLTRYFKRLVGVTPGQYQRASKIVQDDSTQLQIR